MKFVIGRASSYDSETMEFSTLEELQTYMQTVGERMIIRFPGCETKNTGDWFDIKDKKTFGEILIFDDYL